MAKKENSKFDQAMQDEGMPGFGIMGRVGRAKKDFEIVQGDVKISIKQGDEISEAKVPKKYWANLKTEGVL